MIFTLVAFIILLGGGTNGILIGIGLDIANFIWLCSLFAGWTYMKKEVKNDDDGN
jgi:hypothetical protein